VTLANKPQQPAGSPIVREKQAPMLSATADPWRLSQIVTRRSVSSADTGPLAVHNQ